MSSDRIPSDVSRRKFLQVTVSGAAMLGAWPQRLAAEEAQAIQFNPDAALQKAIYAEGFDGFLPNSPEFDITHDGVEYRAQRAEHLGTGEVRVYYCVMGDWQNVYYVVRPLVP